MEKHNQNKDQAMKEFHMLAHTSCYCKVMDLIIHLKYS